MNLYLDHAATSFPKAPGVPEEAARFLSEDAGNPGRGGHTLAARAAGAVHRARLNLARLLGIDDSARLALTSGTTESLNVALQGLLGDGARVLIGADAHNSVLRPLHVLAQRRGVQVGEVACDDVLRWDLDDLATRLRQRTDVVVVSHGSNVTGALQDLEQIARLAHAAGAKVVVDAAQTVGCVPIDVGTVGVDALAFSGHKALLGPTGTGGLYLRPGLDVPPLLTGGTGSASESEAPPDDMPGCLETGTSNAVGFAALATAVEWLAAQDPQERAAQSQSVGDALRAALCDLPGVTAFCAGDLPLVSVTAEGWDPQELALVLDSLGIAVRAGLHCAPRAHRRLGTLPGGTLRASAGPFVTRADVESFGARVREVLGA